MPENDPNNCPPCVIIITGNDGYAAIERYSESDIEPKADVHALAGQVTASCELATFTTLVNLHLGRPLAFPVLKKIIAFHEHIANDIMEMSVEEIEVATDELRELNKKLAAKSDLR